MPPRATPFTIIHSFCYTEETLWKEKYFGWPFSHSTIQSKIALCMYLFNSKIRLSSMRISIFLLLISPTLGRVYEYNDRRDPNRLVVDGMIFIKLFSSIWKMLDHNSFFVFKNNVYFQPWRRFLGNRCWSSHSRWLGPGGRAMHLSTRLQGHLVRRLRSWLWTIRPGSLSRHLRPHPSKTSASLRHWSSAFRWTEMRVQTSHDW